MKKIKSKIKEYEDIRNKKFLKIKDMTYLAKYINVKYSFDQGIQYMKMAIKWNNKAEGKITALNYIIETIKRDIQSDLISEVIYKDRDSEGSYNFIPFPTKYQDEQGKEQEIITREEAKEIDLEKDIVITYPWNKEKIFDVIKKIKKYGFRYQKKIHEVTYYTEVDISYVKEGRHSIAIGVTNRKGKLKAKIRDISPLFEHVYSDGINWYNKHNKEKIESVQDFRIALIFEITKEKIRIENDQESEYKNIINKEEKNQENEIADKDADLDKDSTYYGVLVEEYKKGFAKGAEMGELRGEYIGEIKGNIEMGIKCNVQRDIMKTEIIKETHIEEETYEKLYKEIIEKTKNENSKST